ncbi:MAG: type II toxin-antitoxin system RelE/ParE family toxin [Algoriphagus sp.]|uniref:type II toxin-antitoxin system RelE/ParE family toxin n=1 Tax=Algoriphagus sp. TaxID=1872435 RepID=UPI00272F9D69|nr:type II toxin-antitoxin system RelE/ParE family toxin [Algoriphagus sp.]MDP2039659.1 type II toxin-antitoxin system RelE/ParE family toxin [Algoriphagus sp.]MDP3470605.1 type II toxin-antitoxin system RelE/ParE family toxin [Algoriphagus sp.]
MAERKVVWTKTADLQLIGTLEYWVKRNKSTTYSKKLLRLVVEKTTHISKNPQHYKLSGFKDIRVAAMGNFSIYFKPFPGKIIITAFWDNRQDPQKLLSILDGK